MNFKVGDLVERKSYNRDVTFVINRITRTEGEPIAVLKGVEKRIEADSVLADLHLLETRDAMDRFRRIDNRLDERAEEYLKKTQNKRFSSPYMYTGRILHLDGDRKYSEKSVKYYRKLRFDCCSKECSRE